MTMGWRRRREVAGGVVSSLLLPTTHWARLLVCCACVVGAVYCLPGSAKAFADRVNAQKGWTVSLFGQQFIDDALLQILFQADLVRERNFKDSYFVSLAVAKEVLRFRGKLAVELEGHTGRGSEFDESSDPIQGRNRVSTSGLSARRASMPIAARRDERARSPRRGPQRSLDPAPPPA